MLNDICALGRLFFLSYSSLGVVIAQCAGAGIIAFFSPILSFGFVRSESVIRLRKFEL